jgi:VWFA-related protein
MAMWTGPASAAVDVTVGHITPETDPLEVSVVVTAAGTNNPISDLAAGDFTLTVDGTTISNPTFTQPPANSTNKVSVVFAMDMSASVKSAALTEMHNAINGFIDTMNNGDSAAIVKFNVDTGATVVQGFLTIDHAANSAALHTAVNAAYAGGGTNVWDGTKLAVDQFANATLPPGPKAVILVSDGKDNAPSTATIDQVIADANANGAGIYTVGVATGPSGGPLTVNDAPLRALADGTAGDYFDGTDPTTISGAYTTINDRLNNQYVFSFPFSTCGEHTVTVEVDGQTGESAPFTRCTAGAAPVVTLSASPTTISSGASSTLSWSTTDATDCTASGGWSGTKATSGSESVSPSATATYTLTCTGSGGSGNASATVTVSSSGGGGGGGGGGGCGGAMDAFQLTLIGATAFAGLRYRRRRLERVAKMDRLAA